MVGFNNPDRPAGGPVNGFWGNKSGFLGSVSTPILDQVTGAAAAYSLRKLSSSYAGSAIRIRRSSDNTEQDIGFSSGDLDTAAITAFVGSNSAYVTKWYDQSGNGRDAVQATAANQPIIVDAGTLITVTNGKPGFKIQYPSANYLAVAGFSLAQPFTYSLVAKRNGNIGGTAEVMLGSASFSAGMATKDISGYFEGYSGVDLASSTVVPQVTFAENFVYNGASSAIYFNNSSIASGDAGANGITAPFEIASWSGGQACGQYTFCELLIHPSSLSSGDRTLIYNSQSFFLT